MININITVTHDIQLPETFDRCHANQTVASSARAAQETENKSLKRANLYSRI